MTRSFVTALRAGERGWCGRLRKSGGRAAALQNGLGGVRTLDASRDGVERASRAPRRRFSFEPKKKRRAATSKLKSGKPGAFYEATSFAPNSRISDNRDRGVRVGDGG